MLEPTFDEEENVNLLIHDNISNNNSVLSSPSSEPSLTYKVHPNFVSQRIQNLAQKHATPIAFWRDEKKEIKSDVQQRKNFKKNLYHHLIPKETVPKQIISPLGESNSKKQIVLAFPLDFNSHFDSSIAKNIDELMQNENEEQDQQQQPGKSYTEMRSAHDFVMNKFTQQQQQQADGTTVTTNTNNAATNNSNSSSRRPYLLYRNPFPQGITMTKQILFTLICILDLMLFIYLYFVHPSLEQMLGWTTYFKFQNVIVQDPEWSFFVFQRFILEPILCLSIVCIRLLGIVSVWKHSLRGTHLALCGLIADWVLSLYMFRTWWYITRICSLSFLIGLLVNVRSKLVFHWFSTPTL